MTPRDAQLAAALPDYRRWLHRVANDLLPPESPDHDDIVQEGYVAMWRALGTYDPARGTLPSWLTGAARLRMHEVAHGHGQWTGRPATRGSRSVEAAVSLDALTAADPDHPSLAVMLDDVEAAYHHGEIAEAIASLSPAQRRYVFARFWLGLDPAARTPEMRALVAEVPVLRQRWLWSGTSKQRGARQRLAERLAHLVAA